MYARFGRWVGDKGWFRPIATRVVPALDRALGRLGWRVTPWPTLLLTTFGRTGTAHTTPLYFVDHGDALAVIASNYGRHEPDWSLNLRRHPYCEVLLRRHRQPRRARPADGDEWQSLFDRFAGFYPHYAAYRDRAGRPIPIWVLQEVGSRP
jgi:deazaflavin-dependent oxidoreductase (nitroreductase family)